MKMAKFYCYCSQMFLLLLLPNYSFSSGGAGGFLKKVMRTPKITKLSDDFGYRGDPVHIACFHNDSGAILTWQVSRSDFVLPEDFLRKLRNDRDLAVVVDGMAIETDTYTKKTPNALAVKWFQNSNLNICFILYTFVKRFSILPANPKFYKELLNVAYSNRFEFISKVGFALSSGVFNNRDPANDHHISRIDTRLYVFGFSLGVHMAAFFSRKLEEEFGHKAAYLFALATGKTQGFIGTDRMMVLTDAHNIQGIHTANDEYEVGTMVGHSDIIVRGLPKFVALHHVAPFLHRLVAAADMTMVGQPDPNANGKVENGRNLNLASPGECHLGVNWKGLPKGPFYMDYSKHQMLMDIAERIPNPCRRKPKSYKRPAQPAPPGQSGAVATAA